MSECSLKEFGGPWKNPQVLTCRSSPHLREYCLKQGKSYLLIINPLPIKSDRISQDKSDLPERTQKQIIDGWKNGQELERQYCASDGYWYWVVYRANLMEDTFIAKHKEHLVMLSAVIAAILIIRNS